MRRFTVLPWRTGFGGLVAACVRGSRLPPHHVLVIVITVCGLAGCASPKGFLKPVAAPAPGTSQVEVLAATTRVESTPDEMFSGYRGPGLAFADIVVSIPPTHQRGNVEKPSEIPGNPETDFVTLRRTNFLRSESEARATLHQLVKTKPKRQVLVFVHGFNNRFEDAVFRLAQIVHDYRAEADVVPILFSWPSRANPLAYGYDRESSDYSRDALEKGLRFLVKDPEIGEITVFAHSMGNWVTLEALRQMALRDGRVAEKIRYVVLAAPDVDVSVALQQIAAMGPRTHRPSFFLFAGQDDRALAISRWLHLDQRLGSIDPDEERWKSKLRSEGISAFNLTNAPSEDIAHHSKIFEALPQVVALAGHVMSSRQTVTDSRVSPGDKITGLTVGAAAAVGQVAGTVLSAPFAIDPHEHFGDQIDTLDDKFGAFGQSVQDIAAPQ
jgi:esterase/lipase superfamily enzyme